MRTDESLVNGLSYKLFRIIFIVCAIYFFLMGSGLIFLPEVLIKGFTDVEVNPAIIGMLRGAGGSILPYSLLYILIFRDPFRRQWALSVILSANVAAIILDIVSIVLSEYEFSYTMFDIPVEVMSITGIWMIWSSRKKIQTKQNVQPTA